MRALFKLAWVEVKLFVREPLALVFAFAFPFFMLLVLAGVFGDEVETNDPESVRIWRGVGPITYYIPTYVGLVMAAMGLITLPLRLAGYRENGVLRRFRAAGVPLPVILGSQVLVSSAMAGLGAIGIIVAGRLIYGTGIPANWALAIPGILIGLLLFSAIGLFLGAVLPTARAVQGAGLSLFLGMMMISGSGPPLGVLTSPMRAASDAMPLTHLNLLLQDAWLGFGWNPVQMLITLAFLVVAGALAFRFFRWE